MRKNHRGQRPESDEPLSAGRVEYLEQARARVRARRLRRTALIVAVLTAVVLFTTGLVGSSVALVKDCVDTTRIALMPGPGWPQQTGVMEPTPVLPMTGGFVELGGDSCVVYSRTGTRLNSILWPSGAGGGQDPFCALQPLRQRAAGGEPHPEPLHQKTGKQDLPLRHVR